MHVLFSSTSTSSRPGTGTVVQKIEIHVEMGATHKRSKKSTRVPLCAHTGTMLLVFKELICLIFMCMYKMCVVFKKCCTFSTGSVQRWSVLCISAQLCGTDVLVTFCW